MVDSVCVHVVGGAACSVLSGGFCVTDEPADGGAPRGRNRKRRKPSGSSRRRRNKSIHVSRPEI